MPAVDRDWSLPARVLARVALYGALAGVGGAVLWARVAHGADGAPDMDTAALWVTGEIVVGLSLGITAIAAATRVVLRPVQAWHKRNDEQDRVLARHSAALGLREDDTPLRDRVAALEVELADSRRERAEARAMLERVEAQGAAVLAAVARGSAE